MNPKRNIPFPPHLTMDKYVAHLDAFFKTLDPEKVRRQKELEERIDRRFRVCDVERPASPPATP
jgi:hypothetical protein